jgi:hypothetical protein
VRRSKQALIALAVAGVAATLCAVLVAVLASRDSSSVGGATGPGVLEPDRGARHLADNAPATPASPPRTPPTSGPHRPLTISRDRRALSDDQLLQALELGNVVLFYADAAPPSGLVAVQRDVSGPFDPELAAAGQAVILARRPGVQGVVAVAWRRRLVARDASDPALRAFAEAWLGRGPG